MAKVKSVSLWVALPPSLGKLVGMRVLVCITHPTVFDWLIGADTPPGNPLFSQTFFVFLVFSNRISVFCANRISCNCMRVLVCITHARVFGRLIGAHTS